MTLYEMGEGARQLYEMFDNGDIDEETLNDTIENFGVEDKLEDYCKLIRQLDTDTETLKLEEARLEKKRKRAEKTIDKLKNNLILFFFKTGKEKEKAGMFSLSVRQTEAVNILDLEKIPNEYKTEKITVSANKNGIKAAIKAGAKIEGVEIQTNKSIQIK